MSSPVDENVLNQLKGDQSELLNKIDELRTFGVGDPVEPLQIVVCGNQSSGKSSVLETISRVRFPVGTNICTRFATEIILRRHPSDRIKVSIEPGNSRDDVQEREKLHAFTTESFSSGEDLPALVEAAKECMGLCDAAADLTPNSGFTDDVLRVEISGPDLPELTLVDLPGLYPSTSSEQGEPGMRIVQSLTEHYMTNPRTIILVVISARDDIHSQKVLNIAQQFDPKYERVLGIVTKPDIPTAGSEDYHLRLIRNEVVKLQLGWHVLCNRSPETIDLSDTARDVKEKEFFNTGRWASLAREQVGIESLRNHLSTILLAHTGRSLSGLIFNMQEKLLRNEQALIKLGTSRISVQQQRRFLIDISSKFSRITNQALNGFYVDEFFGGYEEDAGNTEERPFRRLRAIIRELNEYFARAMSIRGQRRIIQVSPLHEFDLVLEASNPYMLNWTPTYINVESLHEEIRQKAREIPGIELPGSVKQLLVGSLFRDQCKPWKGIAKAHILNVWSAVEYFLQLVLKYLVDDHVRASMMRHLISPKLEKMKETLMEKLDELLSYYKRGPPLPLGNAYLHKMRDFVSDRQPRIDLARVAGAVIPPQTPDESGSLQIIDQMQAYYDTTILTFVQNVAILAIENCLLSPLEDVFSSQTIVDMDDDQVQKVAAEPPENPKKRKRLDDEIEMLRDGKRMLAAYKQDKKSMPKPPILGFSTSQASAPHSAMNQPQTSPALGPVQNNALAPSPAPPQKANFTQGPRNSPSMSRTAEASTPISTPTFTKQRSKQFTAPSFPAFPSATAQNGAQTPGHTPFIFGRPNTPSQVGCTSSTAPKIEPATPFTFSSAFGTSSTAATPFTPKDACKQDLDKIPKTKGFTKGFS